MLFCLLLLSLLLLLLLDPQPWSEGSYELAVRHFVLPSFFLSIRELSWYWFISFSCMVLGVQVLSMAEPDFLKKIFFATKVGFLKFIGKFSH